MPDTARSSTSHIVGRNIRAEMVRRGISQAAIAKLLDISQAAVSARLRGETRITMDDAATIAAHLKVPMSVLLDGVEAEDVA
jgi:transcriptional regulator with XRE-family HTH domain